MCVHVCPCVMWMTSMCIGVFVCGVHMCVGVGVCMCYVDR